MLTRYEFNRLPPPQKYAYVWNECTLLTQRMETDKVRVELFYPPPYLDEFWIEVYYNGECNELEKVVSFKAQQLPEAYLDQIDLKELPL